MTLCYALQELASSANVMRLISEKTCWQAHNAPLIAAIVQNATERLEKPSSKAAMQLNTQNILDIFHAAAVLGFHPQEGLFLQTVLKMLELRMQEFSAQVCKRTGIVLGHLEFACLLSSCSGRNTSLIQFVSMPWRRSKSSPMWAVVTHR